jgi:flagellum-specific ATP synthase
VLLLMDSLTRYAMAQREIALAIGEPPATKGYPPSCFAKLPQLVERSRQRAARRRLDHRVLHRAQRGRRPAGPDRRRRARAILTAIDEGDDQQDPIADAARGILDGHIVLS